MQQLIEFDKQIILASGSLVRAELLKNAGFEFVTIPSGFDESTVHELMNKEDAEPGDIAELLARTKAEIVSGKNPDALVIGADQTLSVDGEIFRKSETMEQARETLLSLRAKTHDLNSAICVAEQGEVIWSYSDRASLSMKDFSPEFLGRYLAGAGPEILNSVGAYQLEGLGIHLFEKIQGNYFTILGLPMLPLIEFFRKIAGNSR